MKRVVIRTRSGNLKDPLVRLTAITLTALLVLMAGYVGLAAAVAGLALLARWQYVVRRSGPVAEEQFQFVRSP